MLISRHADHTAEDPTDGFGFSYGCVDRGRAETVRRESYSRSRKPGG
jgi:hypothetical protein